MAQIIYGTTIDQLTEYVLTDVSEMSKKWPDTRAIILVPENRKLSTERRYLDKTERGGLMMAEVLSFSRLAFRIFDLVGITQSERLSREGQAMLLAALIEEHKNDLQLFHRLAKRSGYVEKILSVIAYLRRYNVDPDMIQSAADQTQDSSLRAKFHDISILSKYYDEALTKLGRSDAERSLEDCALLLESIIEGRAAKHIKERLKLLSSAWVWVSGYGEIRSFTPLEYRILMALENLVEEMRITVVTDSLIEKGSQANEVNPAYVIGSLTAVGLQHRMSIAAKLYVPDMREHVKLISRVLDYQFDEQQFSNQRLIKQMSDRISIRLTSDMYAEVSNVAGEIKRLTLDGRYRYRDIAVCLSDSAAYLPLLKTIFPSYEIPAFIDLRRSLADTPLMRFILPLLDLAKSNWQHDHLMAVLRAGVLPLSVAEVDQLENFWLKYGMKHSSIFHIERYPDDLASLVESQLLPLRSALGELSRQKNCRNLILQLKKIMRMPQINLMVWVQSEVERLSQDSADDYAVSLAKAWNSLGQILTELDALFAGKPFELANLKQILQVAAESNFSGVIPTDLDQVTVGSAHQLLGDNQKILFVLGAKESAFPANTSDSGLLKDSDCAYLSGIHDLDLPGLNEYKAEEDSFIIRQLLVLPSDKLYISFTGGRTDMAASIELLHRAFNLPVTLIESTIDQVDDKRLMSKEELLRQLMLRKSSRQLSDEWLQLGRLLEDDVIDALFETETAENEIDQAKIAKLTRELLASMPNLSVSALETYAACPYEYLSKYLLRVSEREVYEPSPMNRGSLLHAVFEKLFHELSDALSKTKDQSAVDAVWADFLSRNPRLESERLYLSAIDEDPEFSVFESSGNRYAAGRPVKKVIEVAWPYLIEQLRDSGYIPYSFEQSFGHHRAIPELQYVTEEGLRLSLRGIIDRVDIRQLDNGRIGYRVIDYKSSEHKIRYDELYDGLDLQILTYLEAVAAAGLEDIERQRLIAEEGMYIKLDEAHQTVAEAPVDYHVAVRNAMGKYFKPSLFGRTPEELALLMRMNHDNWTRLTKQIVDGQFDIEPKMSGQSGLPCEYCEHRQSCSIEKESSKVKRLPGLKALPNEGDEKNGATILLAYLEKKYGRID